MLRAWWSWRDIICLSKSFQEKALEGKKIFQKKIRVFSPKENTDLSYLAGTIDFLSKTEFSSQTMFLLT